MNDFASSYVGQLRQLVGNRLLLLPGARIVIQDDEGRILLQRRSDFGVWGLLGGNAEGGEDLSSLIVREVKEETGLEIFNVQPFGFGSDPKLESFTYPNGHRAQHFCINFYTRHFVGTPKVMDDESLDLSWYSPLELPEMLPNMHESVRAYQRFLQSNRFQMF